MTAADIYAAQAKTLVAALSPRPRGRRPVYSARADMGAEQIGYLATSHPFG